MALVSNEAQVFLVNSDVGVTAVDPTIDYDEHSENSRNAHCSEGDVVPETGADRDDANVGEASSNIVIEGPSDKIASSIDDNRNVHSNDISGEAGSKVIPTQETYGEWQRAYDHFNEYLFENTLANCLLTLEGQKSSYGYFVAERFERKDGQQTDGIALNPQQFVNHTLKETLSTLVHEMVHLWQQQYGKPGRGRYHNKKWAEKMEAVGLIPSSTGKPGGKRTGDHVTHYIAPGGPFSRAIEALMAQGFGITWQQVTASRRAGGGDDGGTPGGDRTSLSGKRTKFVCPHEGCKLKAWAKASAALLCETHHEKLQPVETVAAPA